MFYPTVVTENTSVRHIVRDKQYCVCGSKYNPYSTFVKKDFKRIQFKQSVDIDCPNCKSMIK